MHRRQTVLVADAIPVEKGVGRKIARGKITDLS